MGLIPIAVSFMLTHSGHMIFKEAPYGIQNEPFAPCYVFLFGVFRFLWYYGLYPTCLRKQRVSKFCAELVFSKYILECLLLEFWLPLEYSVQLFFHTLGLNIEKILEEPPFEIFSDVYLLFDPTTHLLAQYFVSTMFLVAVLHVTEVIDLDASHFGVSFPFRKMVKYVRRSVIKLLGIKVHKRTKPKLTILAHDMVQF